ncbi:hypothetical protein EVAR_35471_1 [Eumeta japonica]|uniref:Uncharacterized protein n=1 Tax=Eumeta variegata TaxID=151549 RepID=A0A4C1XM09_EUMVA|nr:hypothetical protein EVAR_35471_1 [Eumeta japonica]
MGRDTNRGKGSTIFDEPSGIAVSITPIVSKADETMHSKVTARPQPSPRHDSNTPPNAAGKDTGVQMARDMPY